ncbi:SABC1 [Auxenochlorella protothecoides x Auxenochlorella symbiontica]
MKALTSPAHCWAPSLKAPLHTCPPRVAPGRRRRAPPARSVGPPALESLESDGSRPPPPPAPLPHPPAASSFHVQGTHVSVRGMRKHYHTDRGLFRAVQDVDVEVAPGTITALLGPSGSGKTTLLRLIAGLETPTAGAIAFDGVDMTQRSIQDRDVGFTFQGYALFKHMTVAENIAFGPRVRRLRIDVQARVAELLALTGLAGYGSRYPPQLSGGQRQRVALARALACSPRLLLLDEPFGALDPLVRKALQRSLRDIVREIGVTTIMVTHDQEEAWELADSVVLFNAGRVEQAGRMEDIAARPRSPFVMNFVGDVMHLPASCLFVRKMGLTTARPFVMVRPSDVSLHADYRQPRICPATVIAKTLVGWTARYYLQFDDGLEMDLLVSKKEDRALYDFGVKQRVYVSCDPSLMLPFEPAELNDPLSEEVLLSRLG